MASRKDVLLIQVVSAFAQGCGGAGIDDDAADWFHTHYYEWIDAVKGSTGDSPLDVWAGQGKGFLDKFREIGDRAATASGGNSIGSATLQDSAAFVERGSDCPYCPDKP